MDRNKLAHHLAQAFFHDPLYTYSLPNSSHRYRVVVPMMQVMLTYGLCQGTVDVAPQEAGAAIWLGPEDPFVDHLKMILAGIMAPVMKAGWQGLRRMLAFSVSLEKIHTRQPLEHWYLFILGVAPKYQGNGVGSRLLETGLARADTTAHPCYLETLSESNVGFYRRHGFEITHEDATVSGAPFWTMLRKGKTIKGL